jgi:hypothetical protein
MTGATRFHAYLAIVNAISCRIQRPAARGLIRQSAIFAYYRLIFALIFHLVGTLGSCGAADAQLSPVRGCVWTTSYGFPFTD